MTVYLRVFLPFVFAYFIASAYRSINAVIAPDLVRELGLGAAQLGLLTGAYLLVFGLAQIPLGMALDRWGARRTHAVLLMIGALGSALFALGHDVLTLTIGRGLIGLGGAGGVMAAFKAFVRWFPPLRWPLVNGLHMALGGLGVAAAAAPAEYVLTFTDWRGLFWVLAGLSAFCALAVAAAVPRHEEPDGDSRLIDALRGVGQVFFDRGFQSFAPLAAVALGTLLALQGLWAGPWLRDIAGFDRGAIAATLTVMALCMTAGFAAAGLIADRLAGLGIKPITVSAVGLGLFLLAQAALIAFGDFIAAIAWPLFSFLGTFGTLSYAVFSRRFPEPLAGRVNTGLNLLVFSVAFAVQWGVGVILGLWPDAAGYAPAAYRVAFGLLLAIQLAAGLWFVFSARRAGFYESPSKTPGPR